MYTSFYIAYKNYLSIFRNIMAIKADIRVDFDVYTGRAIFAEAISNIDTCTVVLCNIILG